MSTMEQWNSMALEWFSKSGKKDNERQRDFLAAARENLISESRKRWWSGLEVNHTDNRTLENVEFSIQQVCYDKAEALFGDKWNPWDSKSWFFRFTKLSEPKDYTTISYLRLRFFLSLEDRALSCKVASAPLRSTLYLYLSPPYQPVILRVKSQSNLVKDVLDL